MFITGLFEGDADENVHDDNMEIDEVHETRAKLKKRGRPPKYSGL